MTQCDKVISIAAINGIVLPDEFAQYIKRFVSLLNLHNTRCSLIATGELDIIWQRHILDSLIPLILRKIDDGKTFLDFGSGGGFPGIVLACAKPGCKFTLAESSIKKSSFLNLVKNELNLDNVIIFPDRVKNIERFFDYITLRATGPLRRTIPQALSRLKESGEIALWTGPDFSIHAPYWRNFCSKRGAKIKNMKYPCDWMDETRQKNKMTITFISKIL